MRFNLIIIVLLVLRFGIANGDNSCATKSSDKDIKPPVGMSLMNNASAEDIKWATDLKDQSLDMVWQNLKNIFQEQEKLEDHKGFEPDNNFHERRFAGLYVFVSTSMPKPLLKSYLNEANKYGGVLVFKGLPQGSFKEFTKLVMDLVGTKGDLQEISGNVQIDDEAYERFGVSHVPSIVLVQEDEYHPSQKASYKFDKIVGNVGIKYSLEEFSQSGELKEQALECLK